MVSEGSLALQKGMAHSTDCQTKNSLAFHILENLVGRTVCTEHLLSGTRPHAMSESNLPFSRVRPSDMQAHQYSSFEIAAVLPENKSPTV